MKHLSFLLSAMLVLAACVPQGPEQQPGGSTNQPGGGTDQPGGGGSDQPGGGEVTPDFTPEAWYQTPFWKRTDRQIMGLRGPVKTYNCEVEIGGSTYTFDREGHILSVQGDENTWTHTYDASGRRIKTECVGDDDPSFVSTRILYEYNNGEKFVARDHNCQANYLNATDLGDGIDRESIYISWGLSRVVETWLQPISDSWHIYDYAFDEAGNLQITYTTFSTNHGDGIDGEHIDNYPQDPVTWTVEYKDGFPSKGPNITAMTWQANGMPLQCDSSTPEDVYTWYGPRIERWTWRECDRILLLDKYELISGYGGSYGGDYGRTYKYNEHDDIIELAAAHFDKDQITYSYYRDYVYDAHGNWISRTEDTEGYLYSEGRAVDTRTRMITYFDE